MAWPAGEVEKLREEYKLQIRATSSSNGADVVALKQGHLHKKSTGMIKEWKRRFFVLDSMGMLYYYSSKVLLLHAVDVRETIATELLWMCVLWHAASMALRCWFCAFGVLLLCSWSHLWVMLALGDASSGQLAAPGYACLNAWLAAGQAGWAEDASEHRVAADSCREDHDGRGRATLRLLRSLPKCQGLPATS